jgi:hypothetical protein
MSSNWTQHYDDAQQAFYYHNAVSNETTWEPPTENSDIYTQHQYNHDQDNEMPTMSTKLKPVASSKKGSVKIATVESTTCHPDFDDENPIGGTQQDYIGLAKIYTIQRPYCDGSATVKCVLCRVKSNCIQVFYPCQHRCVCDDCITSQQVCAMEDVVKFPNGHCNCPLCGQIIKKMLPVEEGGKEEEVYWKWVLEVKPPLPDNFMKGFRHSAAIIQKIHIEENIKIAKRKERRAKWGCYACCVIC